MQHCLGCTTHASMCLRMPLPPRSYSPMLHWRDEILEFGVPNLVAHSHIDTLTVPTSLPEVGQGKTVKCVTFPDPLIDLDPPHSTNPSQGDLKKAVSLKVSFGHLAKSTINGTQCKNPPTIQLQPLPAHKTHASCSPTTKPKSALKVKSTKVTSLPPQPWSGT